MRLAVPVAALVLLLGAAPAKADGTTLRALAIRATWGPPVTPAEVVSAELHEAAEFLERSSFGRLTLQADVTPTIEHFVLPAGCPSGPGLGAVAEAAKAAAANLGYDVVSYDRYVYVFPDHVCGLGGVGTGRDVMLAGPDGVNWLGFVHELGHTLGLPHATRAACASGCRVTEYGDPYSPMGRGALDFSAWEKSRLGWLSKVLQVSRSGRYLLGSPQEANGLPQAIVVATSLGAFWIEDTAFGERRLVVRVVRIVHPGRTWMQSVYLGSGTQSVTVPRVLRVRRLAGSRIELTRLDRKNGRG